MASGLVFASAKWLGESKTPPTVHGLRGGGVSVGDAGLCRLILAPDICGTAMTSVCGTGHGAVSSAGRVGVCGPTMCQARGCCLWIDYAKAYEADGNTAKIRAVRILQPCFMMA